MPEPVVVFRTRSDVEAAVVRALLDSHGIEASVGTTAPQAVFPLAFDGLGDVRLAVRAEDADRATQLIASYASEPRRGGAPDGGIEELEARLHYRFRDRGLLEHALTHRSRAHEDVTGGVTDNESLEFLGDAVLGLVMAELLFRRFPDRDEGQKSKMKARLVSANTLSRLALAMDLGPHLLLGRGEEKSGGRRKQTLLSDTFEAVIAAVYLDGGLEPARAFIVREFGPLVEEAGLAAPSGDDYKSALQERLQSHGRPLPEYVVVEELGPAHRRLFRIDVRVGGDVLAQAEGRAKKEAEQEAARRALESLDAQA
jgi:ribonuclease III